jgi:hypothetical protein
MTTPTTPEPGGTTEDLLTQMAQQIAQASQTIARHISQHDEIERPGQEGDRPPEGAQAVMALQIEQHRQLQDMLVQITQELGDGLQAIVRERTEHQRAYQQAIREAERRAQEKDESRERQHQQELENLRAAFLQAQEQNRADGAALRQSHSDTVADTVAVLRREREEQGRQYEQMRTVTVAVLRREREEQGRQYEQMRTVTVEETKALLANALDDNSKSTQTALEQARERMNREQLQNTSAALNAVDTKWRRLTRILVGATVTASVIAVAAIVLALL